LLDRLIERCQTKPLHNPLGEVLQVVGLIVEVGGLRAAVGDMLAVQNGGDSELELEVVGFRSGRLLTTPLGTVSGVRPGARVRHTHRGASIGVCPDMLGRIVDSLGRPLDGGPPFENAIAIPVHRDAPHPFSRDAITEQLYTGVRAIDAFLPLGGGQRMGIFAGAGVGKSTLLGMLCRTSQADVNVIGLIGERGRELNDFVRNSLGPEGLQRSVIVTATSDQPAVVRSRGADAATAIAEYYRDQGKSVLLVMDSLTRYAMALREAALAAGEPPATKGYPPSVFAALPRLLERAGTSRGKGVITALYTVLVEGDDMSDPIADAVRGILDGHIVLSRRMAERGHFPAIDVLQSISRLAPEITPPEVQSWANSLRDLMAAHRDAEDLIQVGAYVQGSDPRVDKARQALPQIEGFLRQSVREECTQVQCLTVLRHLAQVHAVR
jgi:flagellum-specific ATP synthase